MKKNIEKIIDIPEGIEVKINGTEITAKSGGNEMKRKFGFSGKIEAENGKIKISAGKAGRKEAKIIGTFAGHIKNMLNGIKNPFEYHLEICNVHFPMTVKAEKNKVVINNFLGETVPRIAEIVSGSNVKIEGHVIIVISSDVESAGQTAANIERATKVGKRDRRVFQDGIFITKKPGRDS